MKLWEVPPSFPPGRTLPSESESIRVLLAEDNVIDQINIRGLLERQGAEVVCAANGREAVDRFVAGSYDIVLLDILMQDMDGFEATSRIREKERQGSGQTTPIIALTAYSLRAVYDKCRSVGMNGYLSKPVSVCDLKELFIRLSGGIARDGIRDAAENAGELPVLDVNASLTNLGGDHELYRDIAAMFADHAPEIVEGLITALQAGDLTQAEYFSHNLKGMSANIGAKRLAELARTIHDSVRNDRSDGHERWIARLRDEYGRVTAAVAGVGEILSP
ncbi:MAG: response regulator [Deltaproteobacteria bacterium]|nr:response regulator [Deltaproteobacteria bacterium]